MFNLINDVFFEKGFRIFSSNECPIEELQNNRYFFAANQGNKKEYYLVIFLKEVTAKQIFQLIRGEFFSKCFNDIKSSEVIYEKEIDKNSSMLICYEIPLNNHDKDLLQKVIYEIEEDPYFFKKYVLSYSSEQVDAIKSHISGEKIIDSLEKQLGNTEKFKAFKNNPAGVGDYELLTKLFIKLPFLNLTNVELDKLKNLKSKITDELKKKELILDQNIITYLNTLELENFKVEDVEDLILKMG